MKRFRYSYDKDGYYSGLVYPIQKVLIDGNDHVPQPVQWPHHRHTDQEPYWREGYLNRYDFTAKNWTLEPREERTHRLNVEKEVMENFTTKMEVHFTELANQNLQIIESLKEVLEIQKGLIDFNIKSIDHNTNGFLSILQTEREHNALVFKEFNEVKKLIAREHDSTEQWVIQAINTSTPIRNFFRRVWNKFF